MSTPPDLPDVEPGFEYPDSLDAMAWAQAFDRVDNEDIEQLATWFAAAMMRGQQYPNDEVMQDY